MSFALLHGGGQGSWVWEQTIAAMRAQGEGRKILALDVPGCGVKRGRDTSGISVDDIAAELLADIEAAGLSDVVLVGHSQAGSVMPHMLTLRPDLFHRAVYLTCSVPQPGQTVIEMVGSGRHGENPDEVGWPLDPNISTMEERMMASFCNDMSPTETAAFMAKLGADMWPMSSYAHTDWRQEQLGEVPASYIICLRDAILPVSWQERFTQRYKTERSIRIDCGHQAMNTRPHGLAEILRHEAG